MNYSNNKTFAERLQNEENSVIDEIYTQYYHKIFHFSLAYLKNKDDASDVVQETFIKLWMNRFVIHTDTNFEAYLITIARNSVLNLLNKRIIEQKYIDYLTDTVFSNTQGTEEQTNYKFLRERYEQLIEILPPKCRDIFKLSRKKGLSNKEIAIVQGVSEKTVEYHLSKAFSFFRKHLVSVGI